MLKGVIFLLCLAVVCQANQVPFLSWNLINSVDLPAAVSGVEISKSTFSVSSWYNITVPSTIMASLQENGVYSDPYYSLNLLDIPREQFSFPWWYRSTFTLPETTDSTNYVLRFEGINYKANIWINGVQIANTSQIVGTFRYYDIPLSTNNILKNNDQNCLAIEIYRPYDSWTPPSNELTDLAISWIDWAPFAPDGNAGLWRNVSLTALGSTSVDIRYPSITSKVHSNTSATLEILVEVENYNNNTIMGEINLDIEGIGKFSKSVTLQPNKPLQIFFPNINIDTNLRLWWPWQMGSQEFYNFSVNFVDDSTQASSNILTSRFGIREITSGFTPRGDRVYYVNGNAILIRGGGWSSDLLLRSSPERQRDELEYTKFMGLNAIRMEGKLEDDHFYNLADELGILLMPGWECCDGKYFIKNINVS